MEGNLILQGLTIDQFRQLIREELATISPALPEETEFIDLDKLHKQLNGSVSKSTLRNWTKRGLLTPNKIGRRVLYRKKEAIAAIERIKPYSRH